MKDIILNLYSLDERIQILENNGIVCKEITIKCSEPVYHNDMEYWDAKILGVFNVLGDPFMEYERSGYGEPNRYILVDRAFESIMLPKIEKLKKKIVEL